MFDFGEKILESLKGNYTPNLIDKFYKKEIGTLKI